MRFTITSFLLLVLPLSATVGCRGGFSEDTPVVPIRNMYNQPRSDPQSHSDFFQDGRTMRPPVEGAIAQEMPIDLSVESGRTADNASWVLEVPTAVIRDFMPTIADDDYRRSMETPRQPQRTFEQFSPEERTQARRGMMERGHERFNIYCAPCHSVAGDGLGPIMERAQWLAETLRDPGAGGLNVPTLHEDRLRSMPDGQLYGVITHGLRNMPAYSQSIPLADRWAIVSYVRVLQLNQASAVTARNEEAR